MKRNNNHIQGEAALPKYLKSSYDMSDAGTFHDFKDYKDVPGWINDAEHIYVEAVDNAKDGAHFVEIGVLYGQSATHMAQLIKDSGKDIKFDAIDIFWGIEHGTKNYLTQNQPYQFLQYLEEPRFKNWTILEIVQFPINSFGLSDYVNFITCDERYAHKLYDDNSLDFVWIDGDHRADIVYNDLVNFWSKLKTGGIIAGDDIYYDEVANDVKKFTKEYQVDVKYSHNGFRITKK
jgi:predicted O-methyltransferase YrrM